MWNWISAGFVVLGIIHVPPAIGAFSPDALVALYGDVSGNGDMNILLQHRGAVFALVATGCFVAVAMPRWRPSAAILAGWSIISFLGVYGAAGAPSGPLLKVAITDGVGLAVLVPIAVALWRRPPTVSGAATR